jgi:hypothetical protein
VPASNLAGAGMRRHLRPSAACGARVGAAESFVCFIPLFGGGMILRQVCEVLCDIIVGDRASQCQW